MKEIRSIKLHWHINMCSETRLIDVNGPDQHRMKNIFKILELSSIQNSSFKFDVQCVGKCNLLVCVVKQIQV